MSKNHGVEETDFVKQPKEVFIMANTIGTNYPSYLKNSGQIGKQSASKGKSLDSAKNLTGQYGNNFTVELSESGLSALAGQKSIDDASSGKSGAATTDEQKLSATAKDYLEKLRDKYGDYDFIIADNMDDPQSLTKGSTKGYSVILSTEELERMATDEEYADKIMGHVGSAVDKLNQIIDEADLGEGVQFSSLAISVDDEGNMKLFAQLEKLSEEQQERMEKAKEKHAEEKKAEEKKAEDAEEEEKTPTVEKRVNLEATSVEDLLDKIFNVDWDKVEPLNLFLPEE